MYAKNFQLQLLCCSGLVICYATNVNNNVYNNNQWFGYTQLFNVSISDSHFELVQPVAFVRVINPPFKNFILTQLYTQEHSFCNGTMQFSAAISALLKMLYIHFFYIYSEEVIKLNERLDAVAFSIAIPATVTAFTTFLVNDDGIKYIGAISKAEKSERKCAK